MATIAAVAAAPGVLGTQEAAHHQSQRKERRDEQRAWRCNLVAKCIRPSTRSDEIDGRQIVLKHGKLYVEAPTAHGKPLGYPFTGYFLPYPDEDSEGLVSTTSAESPMLRWIYVDRKTYQVKYGTLADAEPNLHGPFECTCRRVSFEGWEGFCVVEESPGLWTLFFDHDDNGLSGKLPPDTRILEIELSRVSKKPKVDAEPPPPPRAVEEKRPTLSSSCRRSSIPSRVARAAQLEESRKSQMVEAAPKPPARAEQAYLEGDSKMAEKSRIDSVAHSEESEHEDVHPAMRRSQAPSTSTSSSSEDRAAPSSTDRSRSFGETSATTPETIGPVSVESSAQGRIRPSMPRPAAAEPTPRPATEGKLQAAPQRLSLPPRSETDSKLHHTKGQAPILSRPRPRSEPERMSRASGSGSSSSRKARFEEAIPALPAAAAAAAADPSFEQAMPPPAVLAAAKPRNLSPRKQLDMALRAGKEKPSMAAVAEKVRRAAGKIIALNKLKRKMKAASWRSKKPKPDDHHHPPPSSSSPSSPGGHHGHHHGGGARSVIIRRRRHSTPARLPPQHDLMNLTNTSLLGEMCSDSVALKSFLHLSKSAMSSRQQLKRATQ